MKNSGISRIMLCALAFCALVSGQSQAQGVLYTFDQIESEWKKVYPSDSPIMRNIFTKYIDKGALFAEEGGTGTSSVSPGAVFGNAPENPNSKFRFPVKSFDSENLEAFLGGQSRVQLLKNTLKYYMGSRDDVYRELAEYDSNNKLPEDATDDERSAWMQTRLQFITELHDNRKDSVASMRKIVDLELFVVQIAGYAISTSLTQRCFFWREAKNLAFELQFGSGTEPGFQKGGKTFVDYYRQVQAFYMSDDGYRKIPTQLCELTAVNSRGDVVKAMEVAIDAAITETMGAAVETFQTIINKRQQELGTLMAESEIEIPARGLYALQKGFTDTFSVMDMVQHDLLGLYKDESSLMSQLKKQIDQMNTSDAEKNARQNLSTFALVYEKLLHKLASMPDTVGLKPASKAKLEVCRVLRSIPSEKSSAGEVANFQASYGTCLKELVSEYKAERLVKKDDPATLKFAESFSSLITFTNHYLRKPK